MAEQAPHWGLCMAAGCDARLRWVATLEGVVVPVNVTPVKGGPLIPVIAGDGSRRVDRAGAATGDRPGFRPHWQTCTQPELYDRERTELGDGAPAALPADAPGRAPPGRASYLGPCAGCYRPDHIAYGPQCTGTLCASCSAIRAAWARVATGERPPLQYPRWKDGDR